MHGRVVLVVAKVRAGGERYYLDATPGSGRAGIESPGRWAGSGATALGLAGVVHDEDLSAVMAGSHPGTQGGLRGARSRVQVCGYDLTFAAPKSVSILCGLAESEVAEAVRGAHENAVAAAVSYVERRAAAVRRPMDGARRVPVPASTVAAAFVHRTSRALDPHLHSHVVLANLGRAADESWSALDGRGMYAHRAAADSLYHSHLRHELTAALGVQWDRPVRGRADIAGIGPEARHAFSARSRQIATDLEAHGFPAGSGRSPRRASHMAALVTRADRRLDVSVEELKPQWRRRAREAGLGPRQMDQVMDRLHRGRAGIGDHGTNGANGANGMSKAEKQADGHADLESVARLLATNPVTEISFARRHVVATVAGQRQRGAPVQAVEDEVDRFMALTEAAPGAGDLCRIDLPGVAEPRRVTPELLRQRDIDVLLARRGLTIERSMERDRYLDLGFG